MPKSKKELDKDLMFQKIMPALSDNPFSELYGSEQSAAAPEPRAPAPEAPAPVSAAPEAPSLAPALADALAGDDSDNLSALRNKLFARSSTFDTQENVATINVMESLVLRHVDEVIQRFNCCSCDRCRCDISAFALNALPPRYVVAQPSRMEQCEQEVSQKMVMNALVHAVLKVRAHPHH